MYYEVNTFAGYSSGKSFICIRKRTGPKMEPCGTPVTIVVTSDSINQFKGRLEPLSRWLFRVSVTRTSERSDSLSLSQ